MSTRVLLLGLASILLVALTGRLISRHVFSEDSGVTSAMAAVEAPSAKEVLIDKKFPATSGENLEVKVGHSDVTIKTGSGNGAHVQVIVSGGNMKRAREFFEHLKFRVEKNGRTISVTTNPTQRNWSWNWGRVDIDVLITVPEVFDAQVAVAHGDVEVNRLKGTLSFTTAHGDLHIGSLSGSTASITSAHGDVDAQEIATEKFRLSAAHGDVHIDRLATAAFEATAAHGDIEIENAEGRAEVSSSHGDIDIRFAREVSGEFTNSHGDIEISAPSALAANVDFEGSDVEIAGSYSFEGTQKRDRIEGKINGGGPSLSARTTHGSISLRAN
ncbi:MAG: DUF4097 family beta strand repeat-containing protein [Rhodothermales bacterium]